CKSSTISFIEMTTYKTHSGVESYGRPIKSMPENTTPLKITYKISTCPNCQTKLMEKPKEDIIGMLLDWVDIRQVSKEAWDRTHRLSKYFQNS
ncbi:MAG: hypothetical protein N2169_07685, partial [bacterium]|nr:hypothetical protein [bacterium]